MGNMTCTLSSETKKLIEIISFTCSESKASNTKALDISKISSLADAFVITSARSDRHVSGIAQKIIMEAEKHGYTPMIIEGVEKSHWVLIDFGNIIVHVFYEPLREHYNLEELWNESQEIHLNVDVRAA